MSIEAQLSETQIHFKKLKDEIGKVIVGHEETIRGTIICLLCGGNVLLEGVPGLGKTLTVKTLGKLLGLSFSRIQFTPDLMPADIIGTNIIVEDENGRKNFEFSQGPIFANIVLADEINRATPKTQSALLEAMQERSVTVGGHSYILDEPFIVLATQNPIEMEGTYPLPEAQVDRFFFKIILKQPSTEELDEILSRHLRTMEMTHTITDVVSKDVVLNARKMIADIPVADTLRHYIVRLVNATNPHRDEASALVKDFVEYGASPRAGIALLWGAKANAFLDGQLNVRLEDIQRVVKSALRHRIIRNFRGEAEGVDVDRILNEVLEGTPQV